MQTTPWRSCSPRSGRNWFGPGESFPDETSRWWRFVDRLDYDDRWTAAFTAEGPTPALALLKALLSALHQEPK